MKKIICYFFILVIPLFVCSCEMRSEQDKEADLLTKQQGAPISKQEALEAVSAIVSDYPDRNILISTEMVEPSTKLSYYEWNKEKEALVKVYYKSPDYRSWLVSVEKDFRINDSFMTRIYMFVNVYTKKYTIVKIEGDLEVEWDIENSIIRQQ